MPAPRRRPAARTRRPAAKKPAVRKTAGTRATASSAPKATRPHERRRQAPESLRLRAIEPTFTVDDLERSIRFYTEVLGFFVGERMTDNGVLRGVMLKAGVCTLGLSQDDWAKGRGRKKGDGMRLWCHTAQDIDALARRIKAAGGRLAEEPKDQPWGGRSLTVDDPDGFRLTFYLE